MIVYFLPGFSGQYNQPEMNTIADYLRSQDLEVETVEWPHWANPDAEFELDAEVEKLWQRITKIEDQKIAIIAKSIGTHVAIRLLELHPDFEPIKLVLMGIPMESIAEDDIRTYPEVLKKLQNTEVVVIQNERDPFGSADQIQSLLDGVNAQINVRTGIDTHAYTYPEEVYKLVQGV